MAPFLFALALLAQDAPAATPGEPDGPMSTVSARKQEVAPLPIQGGPVTPPTDDYGYVAWCYGALSGYVDLYDRAMPEVIRIERAWPTPGTEDNINNVYPGQKKRALDDIELFKRAIEAAEKASPTPIAQQGAAALKKGRAVWTGANSVPKAQLAQFWMSWTPPSKCETTAKALEAKSNLFGQALTSNEGIAAPSKAVETKPAEEAPAEPATSLTAAPAPEATEVAKVDEAVVEEGAAVESVAADAPDAATEETQPPAEQETGSAIDDLLPTGGTETSADDEPAAEEATPAPAPEAAPKPARKPGLKDTLKGLRGQED